MASRERGCRWNREKPRDEAHECRFRESNSRPATGTPSERANRATLGPHKSGFCKCFQASSSMTTTILDYTRLMWFLLVTVLVNISKFHSGKKAWVLFLNLEKAWVLSSNLMGSVNNWSIRELTIKGQICYLHKKHYKYGKHPFLMFVTPFFWTPGEWPQICALLNLWQHVNTWAIWPCNKQCPSTAFVKLWQVKILVSSPDQDPWVTYQKYYSWNTIFFGKYSF